MNLPPFLHFSKSERRGVWVLMVLMLSVLLFRQVFIPWYQMNYLPAEDIVMTIIPSEEASATKPRFAEKPNEALPLRFFFDPNTVTIKEMLSLGFPGGVAQTIQNYRQRGGRFELAIDLYQIYHIDSSFVRQLLPYVRIAEELNEENIPTHSSTHRDMNKNKPYDARIEINSADSADLQKLKGIGEILASRIIKYRKLLGGFSSVNQLSEVYGIDDSLALQLSDRIEIDTSLLQKINLNSASYNTLIKHPYLQTHHVQSILTYRRLMGSFTAIQQLVDESVIDAELYAKVSPYLTLN